MSDDGTKAPRFPKPRERDPYRDAPPKTFTPPSHSPIVATRAEEPPSPDRLSPRELDEAGFLGLEKRTERDADLAESREIAVRDALPRLITLLALEVVGVLVALQLPKGWQEAVALTVVLSIGAVAGSALAQRMGLR